MFCLLICLDFFDPLDLFHSFWNVTIFPHKDSTITGEGLQILTFARQSWPLSSEGSLACHTECDTGIRLLPSISQF